MDSSTEIVHRPRRQLRRVAVVIALVGAAVLLILLGQFVAAALLPPVVFLAETIRRRDQLARVLAERIADSRLVDKIEVPPGPWGELVRAFNSLLQDRRVEQRLRAVLPTPLPQEAIQSLLDGQLSTQVHSRPVAVMLVSSAVRLPVSEYSVRRSGLLAWQVLAQAAQEVSQRYGALLQPCGDGVMLVFGAFEDRSASESLRAALEAADLLQRIWRASPPPGLSSSPEPGLAAAVAQPSHENADRSLALALSSGHALTTVLPGLGYCVVGAPVEQAMRLQQIASGARRSGLLCSEEAYLALRRDDGAGWQPTDLRVSIANRPPQRVYGWTGW
jgi:hypothetical protein